MRIGFNLPQIGPAASPKAIVQAAQQAEALGYDSLWVTERLLYPVNPRTPYPVGPGSGRDVDLCGRTHKSDRAGDECPGYRVL
jgi:alkanesulfonate monooxygenase SsuD/methylene tetrahydromethanopterin reductase-like flavin-dependent oxidoreductase (luciferase family)